MYYVSPQLHGRAFRVSLKLRNADLSYYYLFLWVSIIQKYKYESHKI